MNKTWNFSDNGTGQAEGFKNAGLWTFKVHPVASLARETIQNSIDAADDEKIIVEFDLFALDNHNFLGKESLKEVFLKCKSMENTDDKTRSFFNNGIKILEGKKINILRISDYYTTGLLQANNRQSGNWYSLVKSTGNSFKDNDTAGGSYGIGKNAPFATSDLRTVFYRTVNKDNEIAFQGVSVLMSHPHPEDDLKLTRGTGFLGNPKNNDPSFGKGVLEFFTNNRNEHTYGTDIFIAAYKFTDDWEQEIIESVIENFFPRIHNKKLEIKVGSILINKETLPIYFENINKKYNEENKKFKAYYYYKAMTSENSEVFKEKIPGVGEVELHILEGESFPKYIAMTRNTGMFIFSREIKKPLSCSGYFTTNDEELSEFLRATEPPAHDKWSSDLYEDNPSQAEQKLKKISEWITSKIQSILERNFSNIEDMPGLNEFLPDEIQDQNNSKSKKEIRTINILPKEYKPKMDFYNNLPENDNLQKSRDSIGNIDEDIAGDEEYNNGDEEIISKEKKKKKTKKRKSYKSGIQILEKRWVCINEDIKEYLLVLNIDKTTNIKLKLFSIGEDGQVYPYSIEEIRDFTSNKSVEIKNDVIGPIKLKKNTKSKFKIRSSEIEKISVEVRLYEDK